MSAGYSGAPLLKKLGVKDGQRALLIAVPDTIVELASFDGFARRKAVKTPRGVSGGPYDFVHIFETKSERLRAVLPQIKDQLISDGMIWASWPKKASKVETTITEDVIRKIALPLKLVDVKVCAVDEIWSGLKLVIRKEYRR